MFRLRKLWLLLRRLLPLQVRRNQEVPFFLDAIASPSTYPCQWVSDSFRFGDCYRIYELCKLVFIQLTWLGFWLLQMCESEVQPSQQFSHLSVQTTSSLTDGDLIRSEANFTINTSGAGLFEVRNVGQPDRWYFNLLTSQTGGYFNLLLVTSIFLNILVSSIFLKASLTW